MDVIFDIEASTLYMMSCLFFAKMRIFALEKTI